MRIADRLQTSGWRIQYSFSKWPHWNSLGEKLSVTDQRNGDYGAIIPTVSPQMHLWCCTRLHAYENWQKQLCQVWKRRLFWKVVRCSPKKIKHWTAVREVWQSSTATWKEKQPVHTFWISTCSVEQQRRIAVRKLRLSPCDFWRK